MYVQDIEARAAEIARLTAENEELTKCLHGNYEERRKAEAAYATLAAQQSPLHLQYYKEPAQVPHPNQNPAACGGCGYVYPWWVSAAP